MKKITYSEAGRLGAIKSAATNALKKQKRINDYNLEPSICKHCNRTLEYNSRHKKFCNSSCSATFNNLKRIQKPIKWTCLNCDTAYTDKNRKYCNIHCQHEHAYKQKINNWLSHNVPIGKGQIKKYLKETVGYQCSVCNLSEWNNKPIVLELEHKDGNSENNLLDNVCLICPNCHSQTSTFKGRNKGNGRHFRRIRYSVGKSY
jgi:hypothetical protein